VNIAKNGVKRERKEINMHINGKDYLSECCNQVSVHEKPSMCYGCGQLTGRWWHPDEVMTKEEYNLERERIRGLYNNDNKFDVDLAFGNIYEEEFVNLLEEIGWKAEIKTERDSGDKKDWGQTNNIAIEFSSRGKKSGILTTEAEWWVQILTKDDKCRAIVMLPTKVLKEKIKTLKEKGEIRETRGGDDNTSGLALIPLNKLLLEENE
tara:strand:+ start:131 stop:754 length:624 start_codon:yes stop_codon:yes gene_type:complete